LNLKSSDIVFTAWNQTISVLVIENLFLESTVLNNLQSSTKVGALCFTKDDYFYIRYDCVSSVFACLLL